MGYTNARSDGLGCQNTTYLSAFITTSIRSDNKTGENWINAFCKPKTSEKNMFGCRQKGS